MKKLTFILSLILSFNAYAANTCGDDLDNNCWDCGKTASDNCTARLDTDTKKLTITGNGYMANYYIGQHYDWEDPLAVGRPWGNDIESVEISEGIKSIGENAFYGTRLTEVEIPASVKEIKMAAFQGSTLTNVIFDENSELYLIGGGAFNYIPMTSINLPQSVVVIGDNAFNFSAIDSIILPDNVFSIDGSPFAGQGIGDNLFQGISLKAFSDVDNIYCSEASRSKCEEYFSKAEFWEGGTYYPIKEKAILNVNNADGSVDTYQWASDGSATIYRDGNFKGYSKKRIFTLDEANAVTGKINTIKIKYR
ncbi:MAG: leucine-rich repeat domain-containing protein [Alphaproteobacteria bacterium]|nr:leucine-rich repeat domain-containing protein [Alphaproteobacteria bacterium]